MKATVKSFDFNRFKRLKIEKVLLQPFGVQLQFEEAHQLEIEDYWEYFDSDGKLVDRAISAKFREKFHLERLVGHKLVSCEKILFNIVLTFDSQETLHIHYQKEIEQRDLPIQSMRPPAAL